MSNDTQTDEIYKLNVKITGLNKKAEELNLTILQNYNTINGLHADLDILRKFKDNKIRELQDEINKLKNSENKTQTTEKSDDIINTHINLENKLKLMYISHAMVNKLSSYYDKYLENPLIFETISSVVSNLIDMTDLPKIRNCYYKINFNTEYNYIAFFPNKKDNNMNWLYKNNNHTIINNEELKSTKLLKISSTSANEHKLYKTKSYILAETSSTTITSSGLMIRNDKSDAINNPSNYHWFHGFIVITF